MRRPGAHDDIHRMLLQISAEKLHRWPDPRHPRIRDEQIAPQHQHQPLFQGLLLAVYRIDLLHGRVFPAHQLPVERVELGDMPFHHHGLFRDIALQTMVHGRHFRVLRSIDDRLPAILGQVF